MVDFQGLASTFTASLWTNASGQPGTEIGSWNLSATETVASCCALVTETGITGIVLTGGTEYWMVLGPQSGSDDSKNQWAHNTQGAQATVLGSLNGGASWISDGVTTNAAFDVLGSPSPTVPEPSPAILLGTGGLLLLALRTLRVRALGRSS